MTLSSLLEPSQITTRRHRQTCANIECTRTPRTQKDDDPLHKRIARICDKPATTAPKRATPQADSVAAEHHNTLGRSTTRAPRTKVQNAAGGNGIQQTDTPCLSQDFTTQHLLTPAPLTTQGSSQPTCCHHFHQFTSTTEGTYTQLTNLFVRANFTSFTFL